MIVELLDKKKHDRTSFSCGDHGLDSYLKKQANQDLRKQVAVPYVLCEGKSTVIGFYTLSAISIKMTDLPEDIAKKVPRYPVVPATLIGRLAVDINFCQKGYGEFLLLDALYKCYSQSEKIAAAAVIVEALNDSARTFYEHYGFKSFPKRQNQMFLPMQVVKNIF